MRVVARICTLDIAPQSWRNGGGWTRQLLTWPPDSLDWQMRISLATISAPGPFSSFPGVRRTLAMVSGAGLLLTLDGQEHCLQLGSDPLRFDGAASAHATPLEGETTDLNLMTRQGSGDMLRAAGTCGWRSNAPQRGLYTTAPGTLHTGESATWPMPAHSLIWLEEAAELSLHFTPVAGATLTPPVAAWWLAYTPYSTPP
jgi:uncharacterized protein